ncbi:MAG: prepilin-type N-terminal cleavage/methylation domain-containing protein [Psychrobacter sp.]
MNTLGKQLPQKLRMTSSGFTLIELMVTIAVLAIIVGMAAPSISTQLANQRVKSTAATLANALKEAKAESIIRRQSLTLTYNESSSPKVIEIKNLSSSVIASYNYDAKTSIKSTPSEITFQPSKRVGTAVTYTICDSNKNVTPRQVVVNKIANINNQTGGTCS